MEKLDTDAPLPPSATGNYKFRIKGKSLPPQPQQQQPGSAPLTIKRPSLSPDFDQVFQCKYCSFTSSWSQEVSKHLRAIHPNLPPHIVQQEYCEGEHEINNNHEADGGSGAPLDSLGAYEDETDPMEHTNGDEYDDTEGQDDELLIDNEVDDDEEEA